MAVRVEQLSVTSPALEIGGQYADLGAVAASEFDQIVAPLTRGFRS